VSGLVAVSADKTSIAELAENYRGGHGEDVAEAIE